MKNVIKVVHNPMKRHQLLFINNEFITSANYNEHAWAGMQLMVDVAKVIAEKTGCDFIQEEMASDLESF